MLKRHLPSVLLFAVFLGVTVMLQILAGAYQSEFGGYPDEPAHYVTGLMVRDFVVGLDYTNPVNFARNYYAHYPKVAFGHWPPFFYMVQAGWTIIFTASRVSILLELACLTALLAWMVFAAVRKHFGWQAGALAGLFTVCLPVIQTYSDEVMAESLLTIVSFAAALFFARYLETERWQDSAWFGVFASLAILTKGNGWDLAIIPPIALILTRQYRLLVKRSFWIGAAVVCVLCGPWQVMTLKLAQRGWTGGDKPSIGYTFRALGQFVPIMADLLSYVLAPLILIGVAAYVVFPYFRKAVKPDWATMFALILSAWFFHSLVPAGVEQRKLIIAVPALVLFLFAGGEWLAAKLHWNRLIVLAVAVAAFAIQGFSLIKETHYGFTEAAEFIDTRPDLRESKILVSSEGDGEGMLISEIAMREHRMTHQVLRATKALAQMGWNGDGYESFVSSPEDVMKYVRRVNVGLIVLDTFPSRQPFPHQRLIREAIAKYPENFHLIGTFSAAPTGAVQIYKLKLD